jgi:hypothetical protein
MGDGWKWEDSRGWIGRIQLYYWYV